MGSHGDRHRVAQAMIVPCRGVTARPIGADQK
jgi:hypothetical protein